MAQKRNDEIVTTLIHYFMNMQNPTPLLTSETSPQGRTVWRAAKLITVVPEVKTLIEAESRATDAQNRAAIVFSPQGQAILFKINAEYAEPLQAELKAVSETLLSLRHKKTVLEQKMDQLKAFYRIWNEASMRDTAFEMDEEL
jgi:hypothetical protein